jgi:hypothetical protein
MVIAALLSFALLAVAWIAAPERRTARPELAPMEVPEPMAA